MSEMKYVKHSMDVKTQYGTMGVIAFCVGRHPHSLNVDEGLLTSKSAASCQLGTAG